MVYNTAGSPSSTTDGSGHQSTVSYADSFSDNINHNTLAYPTTVMNADLYSSQVQYNYDFGGVTSKRTPQPNTTLNQLGPEQTIQYDSAGRVQQITNRKDGANYSYTRYVYGATYVQTYATVNTFADEAYSISFFDGAGRVYYSASNHPGSTGGYRGVTTVYDVMGRVWKQSNPTEVNNSSFPTGERNSW